MKGNRDWYANEGAIYPSYAFRVIDENGQPVDLTDRTLVFRMRKANEDNEPDITTPIKGGNAIVTNALGGEGRYDWTQADVSTPGIYLGQFRVIESNGGERVYPNYRYLIGEVRRKLN